MNTKSSFLSKETAGFVSLQVVLLCTTELLCINQMFGVAGYIIAVWLSIFMSWDEFQTKLQKVMANALYVLIHLAIGLMFAGFLGLYQNFLSHGNIFFVAMIAAVSFYITDHISVWVNKNDLKMF